MSKIGNGNPLKMPIIGEMKDFGVINSLLGNHVVTFYKPSWGPKYVSNSHYK